MLRLLPFRDYDEHDVINMFALESALALDSTTGDGEGSNGVFVKITNGNWDQDVIEYGSNSYLGKTDYPFNGPDQWPTNPLTISGAASGDLPLGVTLNQTADYDENGEKLLYYKQKREELSAVLQGQSVPVLTRGVITLSANAFDGAASTYTVGGGIQMSNLNVGKVTGAAAVTDATCFGTVIGTGSRTPKGGFDDLFSGDYLVVKLGK